jgi:ABC-type cobalamin/Fe3+-siderophores transport system ATPase subunit
VGRGSTWLRWDLHVHTPDSFENQYSFADQGEADEYQNSIWEKYVCELEKVDGVSVLGATDYFCIDGYERLLHYRQTGRLANFDLIVPNVEFRLDRLIGGRRLNYHVVLSDEVDPEAVRTQFLEQLHVRTPQGEERTLSRANIEEIGRLLKEHHAPFRADSDYFVGCANVTVSLNDITKLLKEKASLFGGRYLLVLAEEGWCTADWDGQDHLTRKEMLYLSDALFSANESTREWALGKTHGSPAEFAAEFGSLKPCIHGSDAHSFDRLCRPDLNRYCWIKARPCFEGLRQIVFEPEDRVRIQEERPEPYRSVYTLDFAELTDTRVSQDLSIKEGRILLNRGMVAVIGGRGAGKTALLDLVANCFEDRRKKAGLDRNSFVQRIEDEDPTLRVQIGFLGSEVEPFTKGILNDDFFLDSRVTYLPQGRIEEYSSDTKKLDDKIEEVVFSNRDVAAGSYRDEFDRLRSRTRDLGGEIDEINRRLHQVENQTAPEVEDEILRSKALSEGRLKDRQAELAKLTASMEQGIRERTEELKQAQTEARVEHSRVEIAKNAVQGLKEDMQEFLSTANDAIQTLNRDLGAVIDGAVIPPVVLDPQFEAAEKALDALRSRSRELADTIEDLGEDIGRLSGVESSHAELLEQIEAAKDEIQSQEDELQGLTRRREEARRLSVERLQCYANLLAAYHEWRDQYQEVLGTFAAGRSAMLGAVDFVPTIHFDKQRFVELGLDIVDQRRVERAQINRCADQLEALVSVGDREAINDELSEYADAALVHRGSIKSTRTTYDLYGWVFGDYFSVGAGILFAGKPMDKLSMGEKGTVLLKLMLAEGEHPLIVDQPEESLDNRFIYDELVGAFREAKKKRQILIATSNANLVVNTDSEQVVVAEFTGDRISYEQGGLEDLGIRQDITAILEGGEEAFRRREEKYGLAAERH